MTTRIPSETWAQVKEVFSLAAELPTGERRAAVHAATDDPLVRAEALALLSHHAHAEGYLEPAPPRLQPGRCLGPYEIVDLVSCGAMGDVYRARDTRLNRDVAVKVHRERALEPDARERFVREGRALAALSHPNIVSIFDVGDDASLLYLVTELVHGETLRARLGRGRPRLSTARSWAVQIANGLAAAHAEGIVHRDLKPENVIVVDDRSVKIVDFGLAERGGEDAGDPARVIAGTPGYMAPEQALGHRVTASADLFAFGAMLYELFTGARAFRGETPIESMRRAIEDELPPPSAVRADVPGWLDAVVARCVAKDARHRFESARDLAFVLDRGAELSAATPARPRWRWPAIVLGAGLAAIAALALRAPRSRGRAEPLRPMALTFSGRDRRPTVSPDGRFLAFASDRDGRSRIWIQQLDGGRETPITEGDDSAPRFSPDGNQLLFTRATPSGSGLYRVSMLGGEAHKLADNAADGDWAPDGRQVVFIRSHSDAARPSSVIVLDLETDRERELALLPERARRGRSLEQRLRWSPDGKRVAVTGFLRHPGQPQEITLLPLDGGAPMSLTPVGHVGLVSAVAWDGPEALIYSQALSVSGNSAGGASRIVRQTLDGAVRTLLWTAETSLVVDRWRDRGVVFDARSPRQNLREYAGGTRRGISHGTATDRQPFLTGDNRILFTSNRGGASLDIWELDRGTGAARRLTDDPADDWDPAVSPDGRHLLWSSNRSGAFEIWMADADGAHPRQITRDGVDAENPNMTPDGAWVVYATGAAGRAGVWRVRPDGTEAALVLPDAILPEVSPDGSLVAYQVNRSASRAFIGVARLPLGEVLPFQIEVDVTTPAPILLGRPHWMVDGRGIAYVDRDERGAAGIYVRAFDPADPGVVGERVPLAGFDPERLAESFDVGRDYTVVAEVELRSDIVGVADLAP